MRKILFLFFATILAGQAWAADDYFKVGKLHYKIIDQNTVQLVSSSTYKALVSVIIPETVKKYTVVGIADGAFKYCDKLKSISIPNSVTNIGNEAFCYCGNLTSVTFAEGSHLTSIGNYAFYKCYDLTTILLPSSVTSIGNNAFHECYDMTLTFAKGSHLTNIDNDAFSYCSNLTSVAIPEGVTNIGGSAFSFCGNLKTVTIPNTISEIKEETFSHCSKLESVSIPNSVSKIGSYAFKGCEKLTEINIPSSVEEIGRNAFDDCYSLTQIKIPASVKRIGEDAFVHCSLKNVYCEVDHKPYGWDCWFDEKIVKWGYDENSEMVNKEKTSSAKDFFGEEPKRYYDFSAVCSSGQTLYYKYTYNPSTVRICMPMWYPNLVAELKTYGDCERPKGDLIIPETVTYGGKTYIITEIGDGVFSDCEGLTSVTIPNPIAKIGRKAFFGSENLTSVTIKSEAKFDDAYLYLKKGGIRYNVLSKNEVTVCYKEYSGNIVIPARISAGNTFSVIGISPLAFSECIDLKTVTIPNTIKTIGWDAFRNCIHLTAIYCQVKSEPIGWDVNWNPNKYKVVWGAIDKFK